NRSALRKTRASTNHGALSEWGRNDQRGPSVRSHIQRPALQVRSRNHRHSRGNRAWSSSRLPDKTGSTKRQGSRQRNNEVRTRSIGQSEGLEDVRSGGP